MQNLMKIKDEWQETLVREATERFASYDTKIMEANQKRGKFDDSARVVGNKESYGIDVKGRDGKATSDIEHLVDM